MTKAADDRLSDASRQAREKAKEAQQKKQLRLIRCMNTVFSTEEGLVVLRHLVEICGYDKGDPVASIQTGEILDRATFYNIVRRGLYCELRKLIKTDILRRAEYPEEEVNGIEDILK